jgi:hypothetical protein
MKLLITISILLASLVGYSQSSYIGYNVSELKEEFKYLKREADGQGFKIYSAVTEIGSFAFAVIDSKVINTVIVPSDNARHLYINYYNENYIKVGPKNWELYIDGGTIGVELKLFEGHWQFHYKIL